MFGTFRVSPFVPAKKSAIQKGIHYMISKSHYRYKFMSEFQAFDFLCKLGACSTSSSKKVWPLIDEAVQCFHGNAEFYDMLASLLEFSRGKLDKSVKEGLVELVKFDAENASGKLHTITNEIIANCDTKSNSKKSSKKGS